MFSGLRLRLTLLYLLVSVLLIALIGGGAYGLLRHYFLSADDLALKHKMAYEFREYGASPPPALASANSSWDARDGGQPLSSLSETNKHNSGAAGSGKQESRERAETYSGELAAIFVLPLNRQGVVISGPNAPNPPIIPNKAAARAAMVRGSDLRTVGSDDSAVRLLTYRIDSPNGPALLQLGRTLGDQERILDHLVLGLVALGAVATVIMGLGSWWLAGRSIAPARESWQRQRTFVANASHELRTPLALLRTSAELALRHTLEKDNDQRELLGEVLEECDHMTSLVRDLLLLSRLDAHELSLKRETVELPELLGDVERQVGRLAGERGVRLTAKGSGCVWGDRERLRQVLLILLDNALRHTPSGGSISVSSRPHDHRVNVMVADTGTGIPAEHLPHLFERFYRVDSARSEDGGGTGLGLSIAKALVEGQGGEIYIESRVGEGTIVSLTLAIVGKQDA